MNPIEYLELGWHLIPIFEISNGRCSCGDAGCQSPGKHPRAGLGLKHASNDPETIDMWARQWPRCSWAAACVRSGFIAVDVDPRAGGNSTFETLTEQLGPLPETSTQKTGGDGRHYLFTIPPGIKVKGKLGPGVDLKANGYILIEPSSHISGGRYIWAISPCEQIPQPIPQRWLKEAEKPAPAYQAHKYHPLDDQDTMEEALQFVDADDYETWIQMGMAIKQAVGDEGVHIWDRWSQTSSKYNERQVQPKWDSFKGGGVSQATIYWHARRAGWRPRGSNGSSGATCTLDLNVPPHGDSEAPSEVVDLQARRESWEHGLCWVQTEYGNKLTRDPGNAALILSNHDAWQGCLALDDFRGRRNWRKKPPQVLGLDAPKGDYRDEHLIHPQQWLRLHYQVSFSREAMQQALAVAAAAHKYHPVREYLKGLKWDGKLRICNWLTEYMGAERTDATEMMGKMWLISAVARIMKPGCRANYVLILEGPQQIGKSSAIEILAGKWYQEKIGDLRGKTAEENIQGFWLIEIAELDAFRGAAATRIKSFITTLVDSFRPAYGRTVIDFPRQCVCIGTTNEHTYLHDATGGARFWPVKVSKIDLDALARDRDQLWAEAVEQYVAGVKWWPKVSEVKLFQPLQEERYEGDPWEEMISRWLLTQFDEFSMEDVLQHLDIPKERWDRSAQIRIGKILSRSGWKPVQRKVGGIKVRHYVPVIPKYEKPGQEIAENEPSQEPFQKPEQELPF